MFPTIPAPEERRTKKSRPSPRRLWRLIEEPTFELTATFTPCAVKALTVSTAASDDAPDRVGTTRFFAPLLAIHVSMERPIPPRPPAIR
ncbi:unnamed protein product [Clonostachys rosea]|uniref:Uncharacterized protein n=1 Tax=Bionectria ochroleuca TaxID=29856 RepID=A0ABY6UVW8_BIOOC|nr:unnamed protein product [Clonostachys rosea]